MDPDIGSYVNLGKAWKNIVGIYEKRAGVWTKIGEISAIVSSVWKPVYDTFSQILPEELIQMYAGHNIGTYSPNSGSLLADTMTGDVFPYNITLAANYLTSYGSSTHSNHGACASGYTNYVTNTKTQLIGSGSGYTWQTSTHRHSVGSHSHPNSATNIPKHTDVRPYSGCRRVDTGSLIMSEETSLSGCVEVSSTYSGSYLRFSKTGTGLNTGSNTHNHGTEGIGSSGSASGTRYTDKKTASGSNGIFVDNHTHSDTGSNTDHTENSLTPAASYARQRLFRASSDLDDMPVGGRSFLAGTDIPDGYGMVDFAGRLIVAYSGTGTGGSSSHTHGSKSVSYTTGSYSNNVSSGTTAEYAFPTSHVHSFTHSHTTSRSHIPPSIGIMMIEKLT